jgi:hypothetical protein
VTAKGRRVDGEEGGRAKKAEEEEEGELDDA